MRNLRAALLLALASFSLAAAGQAATIGFDPSSQTVAPGDPVAVDIVVSDLGGEIVAAYDLDVLYDAAVLTAVDVSFGPLLGDEALFEVFSDFDLSTAGVVDLAQLSLLSDAALLALQGGDSVVLATIAFTYDGPGATTLDFAFDAFNDVKGAGGLPLDLEAVPGSVGAVPEPTAALMFMSGALIVGAAIRRRRA